MPEAEVNGTTLYYELEGSGDPLALVHGSWTDGRMSWRLVAPDLAESFRVLAYDRRGHSRSAPDRGPGSVEQDGDDLAALLEALDLAPARVVASSFGGNIALRLAIRRPELFRSLSCHEPPLWGLLADDPESREMLERAAAGIEAVGALIAAGDHEAAARRFVDEVAFGPGAWENALPPESRNTFVRNAPTFLDELQDPTQTTVDANALRSLRLPVRLTNGSESPPLFGRVIERLAELIPNATRETFDGAAHGPQSTIPERFVESTRRALGAEPMSPARPDLHPPRRRDRPGRVVSRSRPGPRGAGSPR